MYSASTYSVVAKVALLVGVMLAAFLLSSSLLRSVHAQRTDGTMAIEVDFPENGEGAVVAYTGVDPEGDRVRWSLVAGDDSFPDDDYFSIDGGTITFTTPPDYENPSDDGGDNEYKVKVEASDGSNDSDDTFREVTVNVTNVDEDGVVTLPSLQPEVGFALVAELTDPDGGVASLTWQWARSSSSTGTFTDIKGATLATYPPVTADVNSYLRATASYDDREGKHKSAAVVSTNPVRVGLYTNSPPVFQDAAGDEIPTGESVTRSVAEDAVTGSAVGTPVAATDIGQDGRPEVLTYSLGGTGASSFYIDRATGQIRVSAGATLNFEVSENASYTVTVTAADPSHTTGSPLQGTQDTIDVNITVTNVEEPPKITPGGVPASQNENIAITTVLSTYTATDPEDDDNLPPKPLKWSLAGADGDEFNISDDGELTFKAVPDYEAPASADRDNVYELRVVATDSAGETASRGRHRQSH